MILLTRLDNSQILVNLDAVKFLEATPDTLISFINGDSLIVRESLQEIDRLVVEYRSRVIAAVSITPAALPAP